MSRLEPIYLLSQLLNSFLREAKNPHLAAHPRDSPETWDVAILSCPTLFPAAAPPGTRKQLQHFLGMAGSCCTWIPNFGLIAKPLYEQLKGKDLDPLERTPSWDQAFLELKSHLTGALALASPDLSCLTHLYVLERGETALGGLHKKRDLGPRW